MTALLAASSHQSRSQKPRTGLGAPRGAAAPAPHRGPHLGPVPKAQPQARGPSWIHSGGLAPAGLGIVFHRALRGTGRGEAASLMPLRGGQMVSEPPRAAQPACLLCGGRARGAGGALVVISRRRARAIRRPLGSCSALGAKLLSPSSLLLPSVAAPWNYRGELHEGDAARSSRVPGCRATLLARAEREPHSL